MSFRTNPRAKAVSIKENRMKTKNFPPVFCITFSIWFLLLLVLYGLVLVDRGALAGLFLSFLLGGCGLFVFSIHTFFIRRGHLEFKTLISQGILWATLLLSPAQLAMTILILV
jgi:hypothetical protein